MRAQALINEKTAALQSKSPKPAAALADFYNSLNPVQQQRIRDHAAGRSWPLVQPRVSAMATAALNAIAAAPGLWPRGV